MTQCDSTSDCVIVEQRVNEAREWSLGMRLDSGGNELSPCEWACMCVCVCVCVCVCKCECVSA